MNSQLKGFNYIEYLKRHLLLGQIDPWRIDDDGKPYYTLLVTLDTAIAECSGWAGQELSRTEFKNYLLGNNVLTLRNIEDLVKVREERKEAIKIEKETKKDKRRIISEEQRNKLSERMRKLNESRKASITENPQ